MRHGEAEPRARGGDSERKLTPNGTQILTQVAEGLKDLGCKPNKVMHSPFERTTQSAGIVANGLGVSDLVEEYALIPSGDPKIAASAIFSDRSPTLMVVSHMPMLPHLMQIFLGAHLDFATADVAHLVIRGGESAQGTGALKAHMPHQLLMKLAPKT